MEQGHILGPLLFLIFVNDAPDAIKQILDIYADDTTLQASDPDLFELLEKLSEDLESLSKWLNENRFVLDTDQAVCQIL